MHRTRLTGFIDEGCELEGRCTFRGTVLLNGRFRGELESTGTLVVGQKGVLEAEITGSVVLVSGQVRGNILATDRVELKAGARVVGDIQSPVLVIEEGAGFEGRCGRPPLEAVGDSAPRELILVPRSS